jgi:hypothetical protein
MARDGDITGQIRGERRVVSVRSASVPARRGIRAIGSASSEAASSEVGDLVHHSVGAYVPAYHREATERGNGGNTGIATELLDSAKSPFGFIRRAHLERVVRAVTSSEAAVQTAGLTRRVPRVHESPGFGQAMTARTRATGQVQVVTGQRGECSTRSRRPRVSGGVGHGDVIERRGARLEVLAPAPRDACRDVWWPDEAATYAGVFRAHLRVQAAAELARWGCPQFLSSLSRMCR